MSKWLIRLQECGSYTTIRSVCSPYKAVYITITLYCYITIWTTLYELTNLKTKRSICKESKILTLEKIHERISKISSGKNHKIFVGRFLSKLVSAYNKLFTDRVSSCLSRVYKPLLFLQAHTLWKTSGLLMLVQPSHTVRKQLTLRINLMRLRWKLSSICPIRNFFHQLKNFFCQCLESTPSSNVREKYLVAIHSVGGTVSNVRIDSNPDTTTTTDSQYIFSQSWWYKEVSLPQKRNLSLESHSKPSAYSYITTDKYPSQLWVHEPRP